MATKSIAHSIIKLFDPNYLINGSEVKVAQLCPTLCDPMDYTIHGILQAIILECVAFKC